MDEQRELERFRHLMALCYPEVMYLEQRLQRVPADLNLANS